MFLLRSLRAQADFKSFPGGERGESGQEDTGMRRVVSGSGGGHSRPARPAGKRLRRRRMEGGRL